MSGDRPISRRDAVKIGVGSGIALTLGRSDALASVPAWAQTSGLIERAIPSSGEKLPTIGIGTAINYQNASPREQLEPLREVLRRFPELGGRLLDTAPS